MNIPSKLIKFADACLGVVCKSVSESSCFASIDATGFDRRHASKQYLNRCKIHIKSLKAPFLVDTVKQEILDIHSTTTRKHDSKIVLPLTQKHRLRILCC